MVQPYRYYTRLQVRFNETDLQGHVNFAWYFNYFDVAVTGYLSTLGYSYQQMRAASLDMLYVQASATYYAPSYFEEGLRIHCRLGHVGNSSMRFDLQIYSEADDRLVTTGEIAAVMADPNTKMKVRVPDHLRQAVNEYETEGLVNKS
jgi:acyl-CoA thioester hydrolase